VHLFPLSLCVVHKETVVAASLSQVAYFTRHPLSVAKQDTVQRERERACELFEKQHRLFMNQRMPPARIIFNAHRPDCSTGGGGDDDKGEISALGAQERVSLSTQKGGASVLHFAQIMQHPQTETRKGRRTIEGKCEMYSVCRRASLHGIFNLAARTFLGYGDMGAKWTRVSSQNGQI